MLFGLRIAVSLGRMLNFSKSLLFISLLLSALSSELLAESGLCQAALEQIFSDANYDSEIISSFKNSKRPEGAQLFDLTTSYRDEMNGLSEEDYHRQVARLRAGDTIFFKGYSNFELDGLADRVGDNQVTELPGGLKKVTFPDKRFRLGKYLGRGNTAHIFELADEPDKAIRIRFRPSTFSGEASTIHGTVTYVQRMVGSDFNVPSVRVIDWQENFVVVERVDGSISSDRFLRDLVTRYPETGLFEINLSALRRRLVEDGNQREIMIFDQLVESMLNVSRPTAFRWLSDGQIRTHGRVHSRQFILNERTNQWILVDTE